VPPELGGWTPVGPTGEPFAPDYPAPRALTDTEILAEVESFRAAAVRARRAGFRLLELHAAHGYLIHQFLSPLVNTRTDRWGGSFDNRIRLALEATRAIRSVWPAELPMWVRVSATDWAPGGWDESQTVRLAELLREEGVDLIDCSSGGAVAHQKVEVAPGYQVPFSDRVRREARVRTGAVGLISEPSEAEAILRAGRCDVVLLARAELRDPYWPLHAARVLGAEVAWPPQYLRARN
jgi:2,4-dienoyl-CoA reductase-like NADH-dependent reductase (Old Yellow Enzyme family)